VRPQGDGPWRAYKIEALHISARARGFRWAVLVRAEGQGPHHYYHVAAWDSEDALDRAGKDPEMVRCIEHHRPYDHMATVPAFREVVEVLDDERDGIAVVQALHTTYQVRDDAPARFAAWHRSARDPAAARSILLRCVEDRRRFYGLALGRDRAVMRRPAPPSGLLEMAPHTTDTELLLVIPA
jgi:hypothetical protein